MTSAGTRGAISRFERKKYDVFYWKIDEFSKLTENYDHFHYSPDFIFKRNKCDLKFYPNGNSGESQGFLGLVFRLQRSDGTNCFHLTLGLKNRSGRIEKGFSQNVNFIGTKEWAAPALIRRSEFLKRKEELAPSDCVTFVIFLGPEMVEIIRDIADQTETGHGEETDDDEKSEKTGVEKVLGDIANLLTSSNRSDATIIVGETEYKVHSCILAARTPVFAALFEHDTIEKATRKVNITDCEPAIFKEFLSFVYTGSVQNLTAENAFGLYLVANKYLVKDLKEVCRQCILENLIPENFCQVVQLALQCDDEDLLESACGYCAIHITLIIRSVEWQTYIEEKPREANEILIKSLGPP